MTLFSFETLNSCSVIKIIDLLPRKFHTSGSDSDLSDSFLFLSRTESKLLVYQNLGFDPTDAEVRNLKEFVRTWGGGEGVEVQNGVLEMELPSFLLPFENEIDSIPGCRISPNLLRIKGDVYIAVEYHDTVSERVGKTLMNFISKNHIFKKELVYTGKQTHGVPYILGLYRDNGNSLDNLFMISTVWEFKGDQIVYQNQGVFQNTGNYVPKCFVNGKKDKLIFKTENPGVLGNLEYDSVDENEHIVEINVSSRFFSDFYNEVIRKYSGPIFCQMEVSKTRQTSYYIVEMSHQTLFLTGLLNNWKKEARADHVNYIDFLGKLTDFI